MNNEEKRQLTELQRARTEKYDAICSEIARQMGLDGDPNKLSEQDREQVTQIADETIDDWADRALTQWDKPQHPTLLTSLLYAHYELGEEILNIRDTAVEQDWRMKC